MKDISLKKTHKSSACKHMNRCSTSYVIRELQIKAAIRYYYISISMAENQMLMRLWEKHTLGPAITIPNIYPSKLKSNVHKKAAHKCSQQFYS